MFSTFTRTHWAGSLLITRSSVPWVTEDLVLHLNAADSSSYSGSGTVWKDLKTNADATLTGSPTFNSAGYFTFNGSTTQYARIPSVSNITNFTNTGAYTVEVWFSPSAGQPSPSLSTLLEKWNQTNEPRYPYVLRYNENTNGLSFSVYDGINNPGAVATGFYTGSWYQAVGVFDFSTGTTTTYRNGISTGATASLSGVNQVSNNSSVGIAHRISTSGAAQFPFKGSIGIIRIYSSALNSDQVNTNFQASRSIFGI